MIHAILNADVYAVFQTLLATAVLLGIVLCLRWPVAKKFGAKASYALWAIPLVRFVLPPLPLGWMPWREGRQLQLAQTATDAPLTSTATPIIQTTPETLSAKLPSFMPEQVSELESVNEVLTALSAIGWTNGLIFVWISGAAISLAILAFRHRQFIKIVSENTQPASKDLTRRSHTEARRVGVRRAPIVATSTLSSSPMVTGLSRPLVLLPSWFEADYSTKEQRAMLAHEITHIKRFDLWALHVAQIFVALQWFNPIAHFAFRAFRSDQEAACDADVLRSGAISAHSYSSTLLKVVRNSRPVRSQNCVAGLPLTHSIKERFILMQTATPTLKTRLLGTALICILGVTALFISADSVAHPKSSSKLHISDDNMELRYGDDQFFIDGKEIKDRRFVVLSDPIADLDLDGLVDMFSDENGIKFNKLANWDGIKDFPELQKLTQWADMISSDFKVEKKDGRIMFSIPEDGMNMDIDMSNFKAIKDWSKSIEAWAEKIEIEGELLGERVEAQFGDEFEHDVKLMVKDYKNLARKCAKLTFRKNADAVIVKRKSKGKTMRAVCVKGDAKALHSEKTATFIRTHKSLSAEEKDLFFDGLDDEDHWNVNWSRD